ncbi:lipoprotein N-acyltransferase Lnb domain-containing protein [Flavobacterium sp. WC2509]|uniref:lipoprotein N-acyltransferase Lnb domain-containing protein n=1 Tax=Flavobacterium sp. WC2509 TaxID=3461406 RepID=UPI00404431F7
MKTSLLKKIFVSILLLSSIYNAFAQDAILSKNATISVMTCGIGNELYSLFGHTAIRVRDIENNIDVVYNYGAFDFDTPNFALQFAKGNLDYFIVNNRYIDFVNQYNYEKRDVYEQELNIPLALKQELFNNLAQSMLSDERLYQYKFIDNNCTSKVVDIINKTLKEKVITKKVDTDQTYRSILFPYFNHHFYEKLGTSILFGTKVDQMGTKIFLPLELQKNLKVIRYQNQPLCKENKTILNFEEEAPTSWWNNCYTYLFVLGFITLINKKNVDFIYLLTMGILGVLFVFLGFYSTHLELGYNYNILLFNPILLIVLYFWSTKNSKWTYKTSVFSILLLIVYCSLMITKVHLIIVLPILITNLFVLTRLALKNKKRIPIII